MLKGRFPPSGRIEGFTAEIGASGSYCPQHATLPVEVTYFDIAEHNAPSPFLVGGSLEERWEGGLCWGGEPQGRPCACSGKEGHEQGRRWHLLRSLSVGSAEGLCASVASTALLQGPARVCVDS